MLELPSATAKGVLMNSNSLNDTRYKAIVVGAPMVTAKISQPSMQAQIAPTYCTVCGSGLLPLEKAARLCQRSPRLLYRWVEEDRLHYRELAAGTIMVCGQTLASQVSELESAPNGNAGTGEKTLALEANVTDSTTEKLPSWLASPHIYATGRVT
jgi:hypothetical protein